MCAAYLIGHGGNEVVCIGQRPIPEITHGEVLVRVRAATVNRVDLYMRDSGQGVTHSLPMIMGLDASGVVAAMSPQETRLKIGDRVALHPGLGCGRCEFCLRGDHVLCTSVKYLGEHRDGTFAEFVALPAQNVFPAPSGFSDAETAAFGVTHLTAWRMLFSKARLQPWESVLIVGIGGGVSLAALQLASAIGARTIVTSRSRGKLDRALQLGADVAIDTSVEDLTKAALAATDGRGVDVVIENVGGATWSSALKTLVRGGRIVTCGATTGDQPPADLRRIFIRQLQIFGSTLGNFDEFRNMLNFCAAKDLRPIIDSTFELDNTHQALARLESGDQFGKVAIRVADY
jgi:NADPH:quinone reductase-like Zn-dependent oxidoreductase